MRLEGQQHGYGQSGLYHYGVREGLIGVTRVQHVRWRVKSPPCPHYKFRLSDVCDVGPIYPRRPARLDVVFHSGDFRNTLDDRQMAKASDARESWKSRKLCLPG